MGFPSTWVVALGAIARFAAPIGDVFPLAAANGRPGDSVDYRLTDQGRSIVEIRATIVDVETGGGHQGWIELTFPAASLGLRAPWPSNPSLPYEMMLGPDVFKLPKTVDPGATSCTSGTGTCKAARVSRRPDVVVRSPAGTFHCGAAEKTLPQGQVIHLFHSNQVPIFQLVKAQLPAGKELLLTRIARDGASAFPPNALPREWPYSEGGLVDELLGQLVGRVRPPPRKSGATETADSRSEKQKSANPGAVTTVQ